MKRARKVLEGATTDASPSPLTRPPFAPPDWLETEAPIESLAPDPRNPRKMDAAAANGLSASLEEFGALDIVFNEELNMLVSGHRRISTLAREGARGVVRTSAEWGHIEHPKTRERFPVRFVRWAKEKHTVANMVANNPHIQGQFTPEALGLLREMTHDRRYLALELHKLEDGLAAEVAAAEAKASENAAGENPAGPSLAERFGAPPFSVLDTRQGYWQDRKRSWLGLGIKSELGRAAAPAGGGRGYQDVGSIGDYYGKKGKLAKNTKRHGATFREDIMRGERVVDKGGTATQAGAPDGGTGTSIFDPVLCELAYRWFSPEGGVVLDPFAGGSVRGVVAAALGRKYMGIELRGEQVEANRDQWAEIAPVLARAAAERSEQPKVTPAETTIPSLTDTPAVQPAASVAAATIPGATVGRLALTPDAPQWIEGDSANLRKLARGVEADLLFTCPPYADLEVYSDDPRDISTMPYGQFREAYGKIIREAAAKLKPDRFAVVVVGEVRGTRDGGKYYGFVPDTIRAFTDAGLAYYNEMILVTAVGSLPIRAGHQMQVSRKIGKTHQNVLVFVKGNPKTAAAACGTIDLAAPDEDPSADGDEEQEASDGIG